MSEEKTVTIAPETVAGVAAGVAVGAAIKAVSDILYGEHDSAVSVSESDIKELADGIAEKVTAMLSGGSGGSVSPVAVPEEVVSSAASGIAAALKDIPFDLDRLGTRSRKSASAVIPDATVGSVLEMGVDGLVQFDGIGAKTAAEIYGIAEDQFAEYEAGTSDSEVELSVEEEADEVGAELVEEHVDEAVEGDVEDAFDEDEADGASGEFEAEGVVESSAPEDETEDEALIELPVDSYEDGGIEDIIGAKVDDSNDDMTVEAGDEESEIEGDEDGYPDFEAFQVSFDEVVETISEEPAAEDEDQLSTGTGQEGTFEPVQEIAAVVEDDLSFPKAVSEFVEDAVEDLSDDGYVAVTEMEKIISIDEDGEGEVEIPIEEPEYDDLAELVDDDDVDMMIIGDDDEVTSEKAKSFTGAFMPQMSSAEIAETVEEFIEAEVGEEGDAAPGVFDGGSASLPNIILEDAPEVVPFEDDEDDVDVQSLADIISDVKGDEFSFAEVPDTVVTAEERFFASINAPSVVSDVTGELADISIPANVGPDQTEHAVDSMALDRDGFPLVDVDGRDDLDLDDIGDLEDTDDEEEPEGGIISGMTQRVSSAFESVTETAQTAYDDVVAAEPSAANIGDEAAEPAEDDEQSSVDDVIAELKAKMEARKLEFGEFVKKTRGEDE